MTQLNKIVGAVREIARDHLRMKAIQRRRAKIYSISCGLKSLEKELTQTNLDIQIAEFEKTQIPANHPNRENMVKEYDEEVKTLNEDKKEIETEIAETKKSLETVKGEITEWETGKRKVNIEELDEISNDLLKVVTEAAAKNKIENLEDDPTTDNTEPATN
jgi:chromosome segregation ATPase